jgi:hypothetical protein
MKFLASPASYSFNAAAGTLTFTDQIPARLGLILSVVRVQGGLLYQPQQGGIQFTGPADFGGTWNAGTSTLTFNQDTSAYSNTDDLDVWLDDGEEAITVQAAALPLPANAVQEDGGNLASLLSRMPLLDGGRIPVALPPGGALTNAELRADPVSVAPTEPLFLRVGFAETSGSGLLGKAAEEFTVQQLGAGMSITQTNGSLAITSGTTVNSETVIRSVRSFSGAFLARFGVRLSQRIANQVFRIELADVIGENLSFNILGPTLVTVTFPSVNPFTLGNVGQSFRLSRIVGAAGVPGRYTIQSVSGLTVTFIVGGWPASGSGTLTLYGWNSIWLDYSGTVATNVNFDAQRRGWFSGSTGATINTTAGVGHVAQVMNDGITVGMADALAASNTGFQWTNRASRIENIPDLETEFYIFIIVQNGTSAPASSTNLLMGFVQIEDQNQQRVRIASSDPIGSHALPVQVMGGSPLGTQPVSGTITANQGTMVALPAGTNLVGDVAQQYRANATGASSFANANCPATPAVQAVKASAGRLLGFVLVNNNAATRWLKVWNTAVGGITLGTTAAAFEVALPPGQPVPIAYEGGLGFATAISVAITGGQGLTNNAAVTLGDVTGFFAFA